MVDQVDIIVRELFPNGNVTFQNNNAFIHTEKVGKCHKKNNREN